MRHLLSLPLAAAAVLALCAGPAAANAPFNDNRAAAATVLAQGDSFAGDTTLATVEQIGAEYNDSWSGTHSVWYRWTAPSNGQVTAEATSNAFDTTLALYPDEWDDSFREAESGPIVLPVKAGQAYDFKVDGPTSSEFGTYAFELSFDATPPPPANDDLAAAESYGPGDEYVPLNNFYATVEAGEPNHRGGSHSRSVWFEWTAQGNGGAKIDVGCNASDPWDMFIAEPVLAVYTGSSHPTLQDATYLDQDPNSDSCPKAGAIIDVTAGQTYRIAVDAGSQGGDNSWFNIEEDGEAPVTTFSMPSVTAAATQLKFGAEYGSTFKCKLDGVVVANCVPHKQVAGLSQGDHTLEVRATDRFGNVEPSWKSVTWTVDTVAPQTGAVTGTTITKPHNNATFTVALPEPGAKLRCQIDGFSSVATCPSPWTYSGWLGDGPHTVKVWARDAVGNEDPTPSTHQFTVDSTAPKAKVLSEPAATTLPGEALTWTFEADDATAVTFECKVDASGTFAPCSSPYTVPAGVATGGSHALYLKLTDAAGNTGSHSDGFSVAYPPKPVTTTTTTATQPTTTTPPPTVTTTGSTPQPRLWVSGRFPTRRAAALKAKAVRWSARCATACRYEIALVLDGRTVLLRKRLPAGIDNGTIKLSPKVLKKIRAGKRIALHLTAIDAGGRRAMATLRR